MNTTQEARDLMPVSQIGNDKLETLQKETGDFKTWIRTDKDGSGFLVNGEPTGSSEITGVVVDFAPNWTRWPEDEDRPDKVYVDAIPEGEGWKRRCDLTMMTAKYGLVVLDLPISGFRNFGKFAGDLKVYGKSLSEVFTKAVIGKGKSKKFGVFNTIRFEIADLINGGGIQKATAALPPVKEAPFEVEDEGGAGAIEETPPPDDGDFIPY